VSIKFEKLEAGMTLYDVRRTKMGNTSMSRTSVFRVKVIRVDAEKHQVMASWNGNPAKLYYRDEIRKLRKSPPEWLPMDFYGGYYCVLCNERSMHKDSSQHSATCWHPKAVAWRKKQKKGTP